MSIRAPLAILLAASLLLAPGVARADPPTPDPDPWWGKDKALHLGVSAGLSGGAYAIATQMSDSVAGRAALAAAVGIGAGFGKEVVDSLGFGTPSWKDLLWDVIGTGLAISVSVSIDFGVRSAQGR